MSWKNLLLVACLALAAFGCSVEQTREGEMPDVDVEVEEGQLPRYDVDGPDIDVDIEEREIGVPDVDVDVDIERRTVPVPDVDVELPSDRDDPNS